MKVLLIHFRYYIAGGPERYLFNIKELLEQNGNQVIIFSLNYKMNQESKYSSYFSNPIGSSNEFHFHKYKTSFYEKIKFLKNFIYNKKVKKDLEKLIHDTSPDIAYILSFKGKLSPSVFTACKNNKIPVIHRISEFSLLCLNNIYMRDDQACRECDIRLSRGLKYRCVNNSLFQSIANYIALKYFYVMKYPAKIDSIICPSSFTKILFEENEKYSDNRIVHIPTFFNYEDYKQYQTIDYSVRLNEKCFVFWGRVAPDKGIEILLKALKVLVDKNIIVKAKIYGAQDDNYNSYLKLFVENNNLKNVKIYPFVDKNEIFTNIQNCIASVIPSKSFDNMPNSLIESQAMGIPVIASDFGCFPGLIENGYNGYLFEPNNHIDLALKMEKIIFENDNYSNLSDNSIKWVYDNCSKENHYKLLMNEFNLVVNGTTK